MSILPAPATVQLGGHKIAYESLAAVTVTEVTPAARVFAEWQITGLDNSVASSMIAGVFGYLTVQAIGKVGTGVEVGSFGVRSTLDKVGFITHQANSWIGVTSFQGRKNGASGDTIQDSPTSSQGFVQVFANVNNPGEALTLRRRRVNGFLILPPGAVLARVI